MSVGCPLALLLTIYPFVSLSLVSDQEESEAHIRRDIVVMLSRSPLLLTFSVYFHLFCFFRSFCLQPVGIYPKKYEWAGTPLHYNSPNLGGDCSLMVLAATIDFDDGAWECQVTASDFTTQDALTSEPVQLVVRGRFRSTENHLIRLLNIWRKLHHSNSTNLFIYRFI